MSNCNCGTTMNFLFFSPGAVLSLQHFRKKKEERERERQREREEESDAGREGGREREGRGEGRVINNCISLSDAGNSG